MHNPCLKDRKTETTFSNTNYTINGKKIKTNMKKIIGHWQLINSETPYVSIHIHAPSLSYSQVLQKVKLSNPIFKLINTLSNQDSFKEKKKESWSYCHSWSNSVNRITPLIVVALVALDWLLDLPKFSICKIPIV